MKENLTQGHIEFLMDVCMRPGCKHPSENNYSEDGAAYWDLLEELKLIECVGSYKWEPLFDVYKLGVEARLKEI